MTKRNNSLNIPGSGSKRSGSNRRKGSGGSSTTSGGGGGNYHQSLSAAEEVSIANSSSLRLMMLQEESEFHLFRQQQTTAGKLQRAAKRERMIQLLSNGVGSPHPPPPPPQDRMRRRCSEPDLMRCSVRIIADAPNLSWEEYRRQRQQYIRSIFFRSAGNLLLPLCGGEPAAKGFSEYPILLLTAGDDNHQKRINSISPVTPSVVRKLSMTVQSVDRFQAINNRLSEKLHHLDKSTTAGSHQQQQQRSNSTTSSTIYPTSQQQRRRSSSSLLSVGQQQQKQQKQINRSNSLSTHRRYQQQRRRYSSSPIHDECCECAYLPLSQTVTLVKVQSTAATAAPTIAENIGRPPHWRACMVSGRDSLSCSLNSP